MPKRPSLKASIPQFALYGEHTAAKDLEFVHIEDIHERSARNGWVIQPHRHTHLFQVLCMWRGAMRMQLDGEAMLLTGGWAVVLPAGVVHGFEFDPATQGVVLSIAMNQLQLDGDSQLQRLLTEQSRQTSVQALAESDGTRSQLEACLQWLRQELKHAQPQQGLALSALVQLVLVQLLRLATQNQQHIQTPKASVELAARFQALLEEHYKARWAVAQFASALHVSTSTLNRACLAMFGQSAKKLLQQRLHVEAKRRLTYTTETLDQIAWDLGYQDGAYFSRVFAEQEGLAPKTYRQRASRS